MRSGFRPLLAAAVAVASFALASCASVAPSEPLDIEPGDGSEAAGAPAAPAPEQAARGALPPGVGEALMPPIRVPRPEPAERDEPRFDVAVKEAPAREFFMSLVRDTPYDVVVHPDVAGTISLTLKDATIPEILDVVREVYGYEFQRTPKGFFVRPIRLRTRIFQVDYLHVRRAGFSQTRVSSGQLSDQFGDSERRSTSGPAVTSGPDARRDVIESTQVRTDSEMDFWSELAASLGAIVGTEDGRSIVVSPQAGIVIVRGMPAEIRQAEEFLGRAQNILHRQVILEAKILEVALEDGFRAGINWALLIETGTKSLLAAQTGGASLLGDTRVSDIVGNPGDLNPDNPNPVSNADTSAFGGIFSLALDLDDFQAFIELLETQGKVRVLSSPRISTINHQKAVIKVGSDEFFVTDVSTTTVTGTATTTTPTIELTPFFSGIALDVIPQISEDGEVILHVHPSVSEVTDQEKKIAVAGEVQILPLAFSTIRESDSIVRARSGQVIVIGGLMKESSGDRRAITPVLGRIPYLGRLFQHTLQDSRKSELVILLRPTVVGSTTWQEELKSVEGRLEAQPYALEPGVLSADWVRSSAP